MPTRSKITKQGDELGIFLMDVLTGIIHDRWHRLRTPGSYEWWYFDAESTDGEWMLTAIFFDGIPMSPYYIQEYVRGNKPLAEEYRGYVFSLYHHRHRVAYCFHQTDAEHSALSDEVIDVRILDSGCAYTQQTFHLEIDTLRRSKHQAVLADLHFSPRYLLQDALHNSTSEHLHTWALVAPDCSVRGSIDVVEYGTQKLHLDFQGRGYHDHNFGLRPLHEDWGAWYWGRIYTPVGILIFYLSSNTQPGNEQIRWMAFINEQGIAQGVEHNAGQNIEQCSEVEFTEGSSSYNLFLLRYSKTLHLCGRRSNGERIELDIHLNTILENSPFYIRFKAEVRIRGINGVQTAQGITEFYHAQRMQVPLVQAMVKTPFERIVSSHDMLLKGNDILNVGH